MKTYTIKYALLLLCCSIGVNTMAAVDTLKLSLSNLYFATDYEKLQFETVDTKGVDYLQLALAIDSNTDAATREAATAKLEEVVAEIKSKMNPKKGLDKNIKVLYDAVHENLLRKYELVVPFHRIFKDGTYNCVTATILYAIVLDKLGISYTIKETPEHVFLIAAPDKERIYIESTDPTKGFYTISDEGKKAIVKLMVEGKLISKEERAAKTEQQLIDQYFNEEKDIKLQQAVALQYYNQGITHGDAQEHEKAIESFKKSHFLYPDIKTTALINSNLFSIFYDASVVDNSYAENFKLFMLLNNNKALDLKQEIFLKIATYYSEKSDDLPKLTAYLNTLLALKPDSATQNSLQQIYSATALSHHYIKKDYIGALLDLENLIKLEPKNIRYKAAVDDVIKSFTSYSGIDNFISPEMEDEDDEAKLMQYMDSISTIIERLGAYSDSPKAKALHSFIVSMKIEGAIQRDDYATVEAMVNKMEADYKANGANNKQEQYVLEGVYNDVSGAYYKRGKYKESKTWLLRGIKNLPDSESLKMKYNQIKNY